MKNLMVGVLLVLAASAGAAVTVHRSFRNGYPAGAQGVTVRQQPNAAVLTAPKVAQSKPIMPLTFLFRRLFW